MSKLKHEPVLLQEVLSFLEIKPDGKYLDMTLGAAGHFDQIAQKLSKKGRMIAFDRDIQCIENAQKVYAKHPYTFVHTSWIEGLKNLSKETVTTLDGVLIDCGVSSMQLDSPERGFSFRFEAPLDMRMDQDQELTAYELIRKLSETELANVLYEYADEHRSRKIAKTIKKYQRNKKLNTTFDLVKAVEEAVGGKRGKIHPATKTFQALRIRVNQEMDQLYHALLFLIDHLAMGAKIAVITFHSYEDRIVKNLFRDYKKRGKLKLLHKKALQSTRQESKKNPRARSAKLRSVEICGL